MQAQPIHKFELQPLPMAMNPTANTIAKPPTNHSLRHTTTILYSHFEPINMNLPSNGVAIRKSPHARNPKVHILVESHQPMWVLPQNARTNQISEDPSKRTHSRQRYAKQRHISFLTNTNTETATTHHRRVCVSSNQNKTAGNENKPV